MANYYGFARSNYFKVKDDKAFENFCKKWELSHITDDDPHDGGSADLHGFLVENESGIPSAYLDKESGEHVEGHFYLDLAAHLVEGWVAIVREIGYEKLRYLIGYTVAVNAKGETRQVNLDDIHDQAAALGPHATQCEY